MLKQKTPASIEEYSEALRKRLLGILPDEKIDEVVAEAASHLSDRADELRQSPDVYEARAVSEFVPPGKLARGVTRAWAGTYLCHSGTKWLQNASALLCVGALVFMLAQCLIASRLPASLQGTRVVENALVAIPFVVFALALLACRPQLRRFTYGGLISLAIFALLGGWLCSTRGRSFISRYDAPAHYKDTIVLHRFQQKEIHSLIWGIPYFQYGIGSLELRRIEQYKKLNDSIWWLQQEREQLEKGTGVPKYSFGFPRRIDYVDHYLARNKAAMEKLQALKGFRVSSLPPELRIGNRILIPQKSWADYPSVFRPHPASLSALLTEQGVFHYGRAQVAALESAVPLSTDSQVVALVRWHNDAPEHLQRLRDKENWRRGMLQRDISLMASSKWRFEGAAARELGRNGVYCVGALVLADLLGGLLGMALLRMTRARRSRRRLSA